MIKKERGFTLIEMLIVVAIIAILASIVIVGVAPAQQSGRDARRVSDLQNIRNGLQLYYNKCGFYPGSSSCAAGSAGSNWTAFRQTLVDSNIGISSLSGIPADPSSNRSYAYAYSANNTGYLLAASLENNTNSVFNGYLAPSNLSTYTWTSDTGGPTTDCAKPTYCITL